MRSWFLYIAAFTFLFPFAVWAQRGEAPADGSLDGDTFYVDLGLSAGVGKVQYHTLESEPTVSVISPHLNLAYRIWWQMYLGVSAHYDLINQHSDAESSVGNYKGTRGVPYSPLIVINFYGYYLKLNYLLNGDYALEKKTSAGQELIFVKPEGFRASIIGIEYYGMKWGIYYEAVTYPKQKLAGMVSDMSKDLKLNHYGLEVSYVF